MLTKGHLSNILGHILNVADNLPQRTEGEAVLQDLVSLAASRVLDLDTGSGLLLRLSKKDRLKRMKL